MAQYVDDRASLGITGQVVVAVTDFIERLRTGFAWSAAFRETYEELNRLSDRDLNDLGLSRASLAQIAREAADNAVAQQ